MAASGLGFTRIYAVTVDIQADPPVARVRGVVHRYERTVKVPLSCAAELVRDGAPLVVKRR